MFAERCIGIFQDANNLAEACAGASRCLLVQMTAGESVVRSALATKLGDLAGISEQDLVLGMALQSARFRHTIHKAIANLRCRLRLR